MSDDIKQALTDYTTEVLSLRYGAEFPKPGIGAEALLDTLVDVRQRLDRIEEIYSQVLRLRGVVRRNADHAEAVAQDTYDQAAHDAREAESRLGTETYMSGKERAAEANLAALEPRRAARRAADLAARCDETVELIRFAHRGLDGARHDLLTILRLYTVVESSLER